MSLILAHPAYKPELMNPAMFTIEPETPESIARAKAAQLQERMRVVASLYASFDDVVFATARPIDQARYLLAAQVGWDARTQGMAL